MTLRHMRIFKAICENENSTTRAAEALFMTQPAVSLALRELEEYYGVRLFDRIGRRLRITEAGRRFLEYAVHITSLFDDMEKGIRNWESTGILRVGASVTIGSQFLPGYTSAFRIAHPEVKVHAVVGPSDNLERMVMASEVDLALIENICHEPSLIAEEYMEDHLTVIAPAGLGYTFGEELSLERFRGEDLLLREKGSGTREVIDREFARAGFAAAPLWEAMSTTALVNAVIDGIGVAILPHRMVLAPIRYGLVVPVTVEGMSFSRMFRIIYHRDKFLTAAARDFMDICRNYELDYPMPSYRGLY